MGEIFDFIGVIAICWLVVSVPMYLRNTVLELRKLNKEFNSF